MNDYTALLIATGRMDDRLHEAERARLATLAARRAPGRGSLWSRLRRFRPASAVESGAAGNLTPASTVVRPC